MKKFLLLSVMLGMSVPSFAQIDGGQVQWGIDNSFVGGASIEPSNATFDADRTTKTTNNNMPRQMGDVDPFSNTPLREAKKADSNNIVATPTLAPTPKPMPGGLFPELGNSQTQQQEETSQIMKLIIDDVQIVQPPLNGHAFCMGTLTLENNLNVRVKEMSLSLNYGGLNVPVSYSNVSPLGGTQTQDIAWAGRFCNSMLDIPQITVKSCVASTLTKEQCQAKIEYKPIENK